MIWVFSFIILLLLLLTALFAAAETAFTAVSRARIYKMAKEGKKRAQLVKKFLSSMEQLIGTILLGNELFSVLATALTTVVFTSFFGESGIGIATLVMTLLLLIGAEAMPKVYAFQQAERVALMIAPILMVLFKILSPVAHVMKVVVRGIWGLFGVVIDSQTQIKSAKEEVLSLLELCNDQQLQKEKFMMRGILDLSSVCIASVMIHRKDLVVVNCDTLLSDLKDFVMKTPFTRFPVYEDNPDNIIGVFHLKSFTKALISQDFAHQKVKSLISKEPWFVPESTSLFSQLQEFKRRKEHMALVVDEYGSLEGIVTLEDILEEIVGEISDEYDETQEMIKEQLDGSYHIAGSMPIRDLNKHFDWILPETHVSTLAGLMIYECQAIPEEHKVYYIQGFYMKVLKRHRNQLIWIYVKPDFNA